MSGKAKDQIRILRERDYPDGTIPCDVTENADNVILIKSRQTRVGEEDRQKQKTELPVLILEDAEDIELLEGGKLPDGVTDRTVIIVDDIS
ncbi:hypothetical protein ACQKK5_19155 [Brevibacillus panacihumi]|uniref:hypothetical protein n=1 Tax=Brevibacillus panacihumi TaxID=497735 RepID=UPI003D015C61